MIAVFTLLIIANYSYIQNALAHKLQRLCPSIISHSVCFPSHWANSLSAHKEPTVIQIAFCILALLKKTTVIQPNCIKDLNSRVTTGSLILSKNKTFCHSTLHMPT